MKDWPKCQWPDIYHYIVETPGPFTEESLKAYKSLDAYNYYFINGKVRNVKIFSPSKKSARMLLGEVIPGQVKTVNKYLPWVIIRDSGEILCGHCTFKAGFGEVCSHIAAVLFSIETAVREGLTNPPVTSLPCWNFSKTNKQIENIPIYQMKFKKPSWKKSSTQEKQVTKQNSIIKKPKGSPQKLFEKILTCNENARIFTVVLKSDINKLQKQLQKMNSVKKNLCLCL